MTYYTRCAGTSATLSEELRCFLFCNPLQLPAVDVDIFDSPLSPNHFVPFALTEVMREDEPQIIDLLNRVRIWEETDDDHLTLQQHIAPNNDVSLGDLKDAPMLVGRRNAMHLWNKHFMAQLGSNILTFNATYLDMGGAPSNQAMCNYINSRNRGSPATGFRGRRFASPGNLQR